MDFETRNVQTLLQKITKALKKWHETEFMKTGRRFVRTVPCNEIRKGRYLAHRDWNES